MIDKPTMDSLLAADSPDPGCATTFGLIDQYVDCELSGKDVARRFPGVVMHLRSCPACHVDHEGLLAAAAKARR
jgi:hypothetical protein